MKVSKLTVGEKLFELSDTMYGICLEDMNWAIDGGLNANMVNNHSFDAQYFPKSALGSWMSLTKRAPRLKEDHLRYWHAEGLEMDSRVIDGAHPNSCYARISSARYGVLENKGFSGGKKQRKSCAMNFSQGAAYVFSCYVRNLDFEGKVLISAADENGRALTEPAVLPLSYEWERPELTLIAVRGGCGKLQITFDGAGRLDLDCVILRPEDVWGEKDPKYTEGHFRRDIVESLAALRPRFVRFPGGLLAEGAFAGNEYNWKNSVGPTLERVGMPNIWGLHIPDRGCFQSLQIGFYELFCLCEDLEAEPLPVLWDGASSRFFSKDCLDISSAEFEEKVVSNVLDLLEFALLKPSQSEWARLRAEMGHKAPFGLHMLAIGSENFGPAYQKVFELLRTEVNLKFPGVKLVMAADPLKKDRNFAALCKSVGDDSALILDEHYRRGRLWFRLSHRRFDAYPRGGAGLMLGEYAAALHYLPQKHNTFASALSEAAFLTGVERNADLVRMASYAPLLALSEGTVRRHSLLYFNPAHVLKTANYQVQELFSNHLGSFVPALSGKLPAGVCASVTEDESYLYLKLVNARHTSVGLECVLPFLRGSAVLYLYRSACGLKANRLSFKGEPEYKLALEEQRYEVFDGSLGMSLDRRCLAVIRIRKL